MVLIRYRHVGLITLTLLFLVLSLTTFVSEGAEVEILAYSNEGLVGGLWDFNVTVLGNVSGVWMSVDDGTPVDLVMISPGYFEITLDTREYFDGDYEVTVKAYDGSGGTDQVLLEIEIDNTPPELEVEWPEEAVLLHPFEVVVTYNDANPDNVVAWLEILNDDNVIIPLERMDVCLTGWIDILELMNGTNQLRVLIIDGAGNVGTSDIHTIVVKKLPDLYLEEMRFGIIDPQVVQGTYNIFYTVKNIGYDGSGPFDIALKVDGEIAITRTIHDSLGVNETVKGWVEWGPSENREYNLSIVVDPENLVDELIETNNARMDRQSFSDEGACLASFAIICPAVGAMTVCFLGSRREMGSNRGNEIISFDSAVTEDRPR